MSTFHFKDHLLSFIGDKHSGKNFILDKGVPFNIYKEYVNSFHNYINLIKLGWTSWSLLDDEEFVNKIKCATAFNIPICLGGTLFEIAYVSGVYEHLLDFITQNSISCIEIASGFAVNIKVGCALVASSLLKNSSYECSDNIINFIEQFSVNTAEIIRNSVSSKKLYQLRKKCDIDFVVEFNNAFNIVPFITRVIKTNNSIKCIVGI